MLALSSCFVPAVLGMDRLHAIAQTAAITSTAAPSSSSPRIERDGPVLDAGGGVESTSAASDSPQLQRPPACAAQVSMWMASPIGSHLAVARFLGAQVGPVNVGPDVLTAHGASGLAVQCNAQALTDPLTSAYRFAQIALARIARCRIRGTFSLAQAVEVLEEFFHTALLPFSNATSTPFGNLPLSN